MLLLVLIDHLMLLQLFDCYNVTCFLVPADTNLAESTSTNNLEGLKIKYSDLCSPEIHN